MPQATVYHNWHVREEVLRQVVQELPQFIADSFGFGSTPLSASDVTVRISESHPFDVNAKDLEINVVANDYPDRRDHLADSTDILASRLKGFLGKIKASRITVSVWVLLAPGAYREFTF